MAEFSRREFLKLGGLIAAAAGLGKYETVFAEGLERLASQQVKVVWISGQACSGCSVSLLNSKNPKALELLTKYISLVFHPVISSAQGNLVEKIYNKMGNVGNYILAVEGSIPAGMPEACVIYGKPLTEILPRLIERADYVVAVGTCAAFGGIPAAEGNYTGSVSVMDFMKSKGMRTQGRLVNCSSCPTHPDSLVGTFACLASEGYPKVDPKLLTPKMFYSNSTHDNCPRFHDYSKHIFAERFGDDGCLFKLGCLGPLSYTECPGRQWNGGVNWCVRASAPCIACSSPYFAKFKNFPFYRKGEREHGVAYSEKARKGGKE